MDIKKLRSKTKKELLELAKKEKIKLKSSITKTELLARLKEVYEEKVAPKLEKKIRKPTRVVKELAEKQPLTEKELPEKKVERHILPEKAVYPEKVQERVITKEKEYPVRQSRITFNIESLTYFGQDLFLTGSIPELGNWDPDRALPCSSLRYPNWSTTASILPGTVIEFKFFIKNPDGSIIWERQGKGNRALTVPDEEKVDLTFHWEP